MLLPNVSCLKDLGTGEIVYPVFYFLHLCLIKGEGSPFDPKRTHEYLQYLSKQFKVDVFAVSQGKYGKNRPVRVLATSIITGEMFKFESLSAAERGLGLYHKAACDISALLNHGTPKSVSGFVFFRRFLSI